MKTLKKFEIIFIAILILTALSACSTSKNNGEENAVAELYSQGYECINQGQSNQTWKGLFTKGDDYTDVKLAIVNFSDDELQEIDAVSFDDDQYEEKRKAIITKAIDAEVVDISNKVPKQDSLDELIGLTFGELEDKGYESMGYSIDEEESKFFYDGPEYSLELELIDGRHITNIDDYSANDIRSFTIGSVKFIGFSSFLLD